MNAVKQIEEAIISAETGASDWGTNFLLGRASGMNHALEIVRQQDAKLRKLAESWKARGAMYSNPP